MPLCVVCTLQMRMISIDATWLRIYRTSNLMCSILTMHIPSNKTMTFTFCLATHTTANSTCFFFIFYFSTLIVVVVVVLKIGRSYKTRAAVSDTVTISIPRPQGGGFLCFFFLAKTSIKLTHIFFASVSEYYLSGGDWRSQLCSVHYSAICMAIMIFNWINVEVGNGDLSWWQIHSWFQFNCLLLTMQCAAFYHGWFAKKWLSIIITHTHDNAITTNKRTRSILRHVRYRKKLQNMMYEHKKTYHKSRPGRWAENCSAAAAAHTHRAILYSKIALNS